MAEEIDYCINCGDKSQYNKSDNIDSRIGYIEGAGQLCQQCNTNLNDDMTAFRGNTKAHHTEAGQPWPWNQNFVR